MAVRVGTLIDRVSRNALNDPQNARWSREDLRGYIGEAQRSAVLLRPEVHSVTVNHQLVAGTRQSIPDDGYVLLDVVRNVGGAVTTPTSRASLDQTEPDWHRAAADAIVINWVYDVRVRKTWYCYPPQPQASPGSVELVYAQIPSPPASDASNLDIDDIYEPVVIQYMLHRAFMKDISVEGGTSANAQMYFEWFTTLLTGTAEEKDIELVLRQESKEE